MKSTCAVLGSLLLLGAQPAHEQPAMTFFITSAGSGNGANLGGIEGADKICQTLAEAVGVKGVQWHAFLSTINAKGTKVAETVADLHSDNNKLNKENSLTEKGDMVNGRGDTPNQHDILTGSKLDGTAYVGEGYTNCDNWTGSEEGNARVGHHDRQGGGENPTSWNSAHNSRGCSQANLVATGGNGFFYCFGTAG